MSKNLHDSATELLEALQLIKGTPMKHDGLQIIETALKNYADSNSELQRLWDWIKDENRKPAQTHFTAGTLRNIAKEFEFGSFLVSRRKKFLTCLDCKMPASCKDKIKCAQGKW